MSLKHRLGRAAAEGQVPDPQPRIQLRLLFAALLLTTLLILSGWIRSSLRTLRYGSTITVPVAPLPAHGYLRLADRQGLAERRRLGLEVVEVPDSRAILQGYLEGRFGVVPLSTVETLQICQFQPRRCPDVLLVLEESRGADKVVVTPWVESLAGLRGRRVAVLPTGLGRYLLGRALASVGMTLDDVQVVPSTLQAMPRLLRRGEVEGAALSVPFSEHATRLGSSRPVFDSSQIPGEIRMLLVADPQLVRSQPEAVARLLRVWQDARDWSLDHRAEASVALGGFQGLSATGLQRAETGVRRVPLQGQLALLRPGGALDQEIARLHGLLATMELLRPGSALPQLNDHPLKRALALR